MCRRQQALELHRRWRRVAGGELDAGGQADALLHRRQHIAVLGVEHRPGQRGIALRAKMAVIAALDRERQFYAERVEHIRQPRAERDDDLVGIERAGRRLDAPMRMHAMQRSRVPGERQPAERGKARRIGARHRERIAQAHRTGPVHRVTEYRLKRGFERPRRLALERDIGDAEFGGKIELARNAGKPLVGAIELQPAGAAQIFGRAGLQAQRLMLGNRAREQRPHRLRGFGQSLRLRRGAEGQQPGRDLRQEREMIIGERRAFERNAKKRRPIRRECRRKDGVALDNAGIAIRGPLARAAAVDQRHRAAALDQMQCDRGADDAGSQHDDIGARHKTSVP